MGDVMVIPDIDRRNSVCSHFPPFQQVVFDNEPCHFKDECALVHSDVISCYHHCRTYTLYTTL